MVITHISTHNLLRFTVIISFIHSFIRSFVCYLRANETRRMAPEISVLSKICRTAPACPSVSYSTNATSGLFGTARKSWKPGYFLNMSARVDAGRDGGMFWMKRVRLGRRTSGPEIEIDCRVEGFEDINRVSNCLLVTRGFLARSILSASRIFFSASRASRPPSPRSSIIQSDLNRAYRITRLFPQTLVPCRAFKAFSASSSLSKIIHACPLKARPFLTIGACFRVPKGAKRSVKRGGRCLRGFGFSGKFCKYRVLLGLPTSTGAAAEIKPVLGLGN